MAAVVNSIGLEGLKGFRVKVEVMVLEGVSSMSIVGLGDQAVKEAVQRIEACINLLGYEFPKKRIIVNLSPSEIKKKGTYFDLAMLIGILAETQQIQIDKGLLERFVLLAEVSITGSLAHFRGALPMLLHAETCGLTSVILPESCRHEAVVLKEMNIYAFENVQEVIAFLEKRLYRKPEVYIEPIPAARDHQLDFSDIIGQNDIVPYAVASAAGGHNLLLVGTPGCGKSMLAKRMPGIMPEMTDREVKEVTSIYSIAGLLSDSQLMQERPFRAPHHNVSTNALIGGGQLAVPGEVTLAHRGILFLDEFPQFSKAAIEALRQPLEDKQITISRVRSRNIYPSDVLLIAAMNPCPCGYLGTPRCTCTDNEVKQYRQRLSGPVLDRIDIQKYMGPVDFIRYEAELTAGTENGDPEQAGAEPASAMVPRLRYRDELQRSAENLDLQVPQTFYSSKDLQKQVEAARKLQAERFSHIDAISTNGEMQNKHIKEFCPLDTESRKMILKAFESYRFSARTYHRIIKLSRTFADMEQEQNIRLPHVISALVARDLDTERKSRFYHGR
jgi:magnesium chelatase family protein